MHSVVSHIFHSSNLASAIISNWAKQDVYKVMHIVITQIYIEWYILSRDLGN